VHQTYRPDIDGLRAFAVLAVLVYHAFPDVLRGGFAGVDVFFVISGYLITRDILARQADGTFTLIDFYVRRVRRIFPALITVLLATLLFGWVVLYPHELEQLLMHVAASVAFVQNFKLLGEAGYFDTSAQLKPLLHLWSLSIEEQFYLLWPLLLLVVTRKLLLVLVAIGASFAANVWLTDHNQTAAYYLPITRFWQIAAGALLAIRPVRLAPDRAELASLIGAVLCVGSVIVLAAGVGYPGWPGLVPTVGAALVIAGGPGTLVGRALGWRPAVAIGLISYPLYLWHWPVLAYLRTLNADPPAWAIVLAVLLSVALAAATYRWVERPLRHPQRARAKAKGLAVSMTALGALGLAAAPVAAHIPRLHDGIARSAAMTADLKLHDLSGFARCQSPQLRAIPDMSFCLESGAPPSAALLGDSHAVHFYRALVAADRDRGWLLLTKSWCPPLYGVHVHGPTVDCRPAMDAAIDALAKEQAIKTVVLSFYAGYAHTVDLAFDHKHPDSCPSRTHVEHPQARDKPEALLIGLRATVERLVAAGKRVTIMLDVPELPFRPANCITRPLSVGKAERCGVPLRQAQERRQLVETLARQLERELPAVVRVFDPLPLLCDGPWCPVDRGGMLAYYDSNHLSVRGSELLIGPALAVIR
jgi:peptidoglycan/LPS O-acetylase OafA/YrhL